jgi:hypothetical protein
MPTAEKAHQKTLPGANRCHRFVALPVHCITPSHSLILFVGCPVNITYVMIADKDPTLFGSTRCTLTFLQPALDQPSCDWATAPDIGASIEGIAQDIAD